MPEIDLDAELARIKRQRQEREGLAPKPKGAVPPAARELRANGYVGRRQEPEQSRVRFSATPYQWRDPATLPPRAWLYSKHYIRQFTVCTIGAGALGKSTLLACEAVAIALHEPLLGVTASEQVPVWYWNGEDPRDETDRRIAAICQHYRIDGKRLEGPLFRDSGRVNPIKLAQVVRGEISFDDELAGNICRTIDENGIGIAIFDPFISMHNVPENDNTIIDAVVKKLGHIADETNSCIAFAHHTRKPPSGNHSEATIDDGRGGTAIANAVRAGRVLNRMSAEQAREFNITDARSYFRLDDAKPNLAPPGLAKWFRLVSVDLPNGDHVAVPEAWKAPSALDGITTAHMHKVREIAAAGEWRLDIRATKWIGRAVAEVAELNLHKPTEKKRIGEVLKIWLASGVLTTEIRPDQNRVEREFVVPGFWNGEELS